MVDILIRGIPPDVLEGLHKWAEEEKISVNELALRLIERRCEQLREERKREARLKAMRRRMRGTIDE